MNQFSLQGLLGGNDDGGFSSASKETAQESVLGAFLWE